MRRAFIALLILSAAAARASDLQSFLFDRVTALAKQKAEQNQTSSKQTAPPAQTSSDSLLDESSASDLISAAFKLTDTAKSDGTTNGVSGGSATLYALAAALRGVDPLEPSFYNDHSSVILRSISLAAGSENAASGNGSTRTYQGKWKVVDRRDPTRDDNKKVLQANVDANLAMVHALGDVQAFIVHNADVNDRVAKAAKIPITKNSDVAGVDIDWNQVLTTAQLAQIDQILRAASLSLADLDKATQGLIAKVRSRPQLALAFTLKQPSTRHDTYISELIYDQGMPNTAISFTGNLGADLTRKDTGGYDNIYRGDVRGRWEMTTAQTGKRGAYLDLTGEAKRHAGEKNVWKAQAKFTFPITGGIDLPISVTWANRSDLIDE